MEAQSEWSNISRIYLMMGTACNFKCRYCLQTSKELCFPRDVNATVYEFIHYLINIRRLRNLPLLTIMFWGGEPLVYKNIIEKVVAHFGDSVDYVVVTNGGLLDKEFVKFSNANRIKVILSNDGRQTDKTRCKNMLEDESFVKLFRSVRHKGIASTLSSYNIDYIDACKYYKEKLGNDIEIEEEFLKVTWDMPEDIYSIDIDGWKENLMSMATKALKDMAIGIPSQETEYFEKYIYLLKTETELFPACMQTYQSLNIDLDGNIYACHNAGDQIGKIKEDDYSTVIKNYNKFLSDKIGDKCYQCKFFKLCRGGCPLETEHKDKTCAIRIALFEIVEWLFSKLEGANDERKNS